MTANVIAAEELPIKGDIGRTVEGPDKEIVTLTVTIRSKAPFDKYDTAALSYRAGDGHIGIRRKDENPDELEFIADESGKLSVASNYGASTPRQLAEKLVQSMVETVIG